MSGMEIQCFLIAKQAAELNKDRINVDKVIVAASTHWGREW